MRQLKMVIPLVMTISFILVTSCEKDDTSPNGELGDESGIRWDADTTAEEIVNGIKLILSFNASEDAFEGTLENLNTVISPQVRVEVHVFDAAGKSTEYGPTTPADMDPGEVRDVSLPTPGIGAFVSFSMHPEVGSGGEGSENGNDK